MATTGTAALSNEVKALYDADYMLAGQANLYWDQLCNLRMQMNGQRGISYNFPIVESLQPATGALDELTDVVPQQMRANEVVVTLQEFGGAVEVTKFAEATVYSDVYEQAAYANGYSMAESLDLIVRAVAGQGSRRWFQNNKTARSGLQGQQTAADQITVKWLELMAQFARGMRMPIYEDGSVCTVLHPFTFYDLLQQPNVRDMSIRLAPELLFNGELAYWGGCRIIVSANAKAFWGSGGAAAAPNVVTLASPGNVGDSTLYFTGTAPAVGTWLAIQDATEPGNTWSDTNELFYVTTTGTAGASGTGTGIQGFCYDAGPGDAGGLRYAHATGTTVTNANSVFPIVLLGPQSLTKAASDLTGPYGETVVTGPFDRLGRYVNIGWYLIGGYGRTRNAWLFRGECGSSQT